MTSLAELLDLEPVSIPREAYYAPILQRLGNNLSNTQIPFKGVNLSGGERFLLEAGKGFGSTLSSVLGSKLVQDAQAQVLAQQKAQRVKELLLSKALEEENLRRKQEFELKKEALSQGYLRPTINQETGEITLSEALGETPNLDELGLTPEEKGILASLPPKEQAKEAVSFLLQKKKQDAIDQRASETADRAVAKQKLLRDEKPLIDLAPSDIKSRLISAPSIMALQEDLAKTAESLSKDKRWMSVDSRLKAFEDPGSEVGQFYRALQLNAKLLTRSIEGARPSDYDSKTYENILGGNSIMASPGDIARLLRQAARLEKIQTEGVYNEIAKQYGREAPSSTNKPPRLSFEEWKKLRNR